MVVKKRSGNLKKKKPLQQIRCPNPKCGYIYTPRKKNPVQCPLCKQYFARFFKKEKEA